MGKLKQVYKVTYPNGMIYVGMDLTGAITYFGSPSDKKRIAADLAEHRLDLTVRKQILWESESATDAEVRQMERHFIRLLGARFDRPDGFRSSYISTSMLLRRCRWLKRQRCLSACLPHCRGSR